MSNAEIFCVCHGATVKDGVMDVKGAFNLLWCEGFPSIIPILTVAMRVRFPIEEEGEHTARITITELDGKLLGPAAEGSFPVETEHPNNTFAWQSAVLQIPNVRVCEPNDYLLTLQIDGESIASTTLCVRKK